jgi:hypothetical protein
MKIHKECVPCLLKRIIFETELSTTDKQLQTKTIQNACHMLAELYNPHESSAAIATKVHKIAYETLNDRDPYETLKQQSNAIAQSLVPQVEHLIEQSDNPLKTSMICSIIGNLMDFGIAGSHTDPQMLTDVFENLYNEGLGYDEYQKLEALLQTAQHVVLFTDNCGEIVFDKILCRELKRFKPDMVLSVVVRGEPIISDATLEDAERLGFTEIVDEVLTTGCFAIGVDFSRLPSRLHQVLKKADLIICKGMANYEAFSETSYRPVAYLLRSKCIPIAQSMDIPHNVNAIKVYE